MITRIIGSIRRRRDEYVRTHYKRLNKDKEHSRDFTPLTLTAEQCSRARFCFAGEFGYEMISWIPYLNYLATTLHIPLNTMSRPGSTAFYGFAHNHEEMNDSTSIGDMWGDPGTYHTLQAARPSELLITPGHWSGDGTNKRKIIVAGCPWEVTNIHRCLTAQYYLLPDYSTIALTLPIPADIPVVVINNKHFCQWHYDKPVNCFGISDLHMLRHYFNKKNWFVVYNHYIENTRHDRFHPLNDEDIFRDPATALDLRDLYAGASSAADRNRIQLSAYHRASCVITVQGGCAYLPAFCRKPVFMLMKAGEHVDYYELSRICSVPVELFYSVKHMLAWFEQAGLIATGGIASSELAPPTA